MPNLHRVMGIVVALGISALAPSADAQPWGTNDPVAELHSAHGANTAGSWAASAMMGAQGYSGQAPQNGWDDLTAGITKICTQQTDPSSMWPSVCNPAGMSKALHLYSNNNWVLRQWAASDQASALDLVVDALEGHGSPAVVPFYGQADHWVAVIQIYATFSGSHYTIQNVKWYDGGPAGQADGGPFGGNMYSGGMQGLNGAAWTGNYYKVINNINPHCDPCTTDPFFNQYVLLYEPPVNAPPPSIHPNFGRAPGVVPTGTMTTQVAPGLVWQALSANGIDTDPQIWDALRDGVPGAAFDVHGVFPSGSPWGYLLVPIYDHAGSTTVKGFVQLDPDDGSYVGVNVPSTPVQFNPVSAADARQIASGMLNRGESLVGGALAWNPRIKTQLSRSLVNPYYEFAIFHANTPHSAVVQKIDMVRVSLNGGAVVRE